jgi:predicted dehydrogenase
MVLFGPVEDVYAEVDCRRPGVSVDDDVFVALRHRGGVRSHLWATVLAAQPGPRMRLLGTRATFTKTGLDGQEAALRSGARPGPGWGEEAPDQWGILGAGDDLTRVRTEPGAYPAFYRQLVEALRTGGPPPVNPDDAIAVLEVIVSARRA